MTFPPSLPSDKIVPSQSKGYTMIKSKISAIVVGTALMGGGVAQARNNAAVFGVAAALIGAAAVASQNNHAHQQRQHRTTKRHYKHTTRHHKKAVHRSHKKVAHNKHKSVVKKAIVVTDEMKIQKTLVALGFYGGEINGDLNTFETRKAVKKLNESFGIANGSSLDQKTKDQLLYLSNLYEMDKHLNTKETSKKAKGKQLQTALKIEEAYTGKIDGAVGNGTRKAIATYRIKKGMVPSTSLSEEEKFELLSSAEELNKKNIKEALASLSITPKVAEPAAAKEAGVLAENEKSTETKAVAANTVSGETVSGQEVKKVASSTVIEPVKVPKEDTEEDFAMPEV